MSDSPHRLNSAPQERPDLAPFRCLKLEYLRDGISYLPTVSLAIADNNLYIITLSKSYIRFWESMVYMNPSVGTYGPFWYS